MTTPTAIYVDPSYPAYYGDKLFDTSNPILNRDGTLMPFARMREAMQAKGIAVHTAEQLLDQPEGTGVAHYYSLGILTNYPRLLGRTDVKLAGFLIMEPPVVAPKLYRALPELTRHFERVYVHNVDGDGYSLKGVDRSRLRTFYWPQPHHGVLQPYWGNTERLNRIVVINGNHLPRSLKQELYSKRISAMARLAPMGNVDLYGRGWDKWWSHRSMWPPYWLNYRTLMSIYRGSCESKYEVLSQYRFSLCFENMTMKGYVTEKIFDCLYAGCIPLYLGAKNIQDLIPSKAYVDCRRFSSWEEMSQHISSMPMTEVTAMREAGRAFLEGEASLKYSDAVIDIINNR